MMSAADELIERWDERDARYARRRMGGRPHPLSIAEQDAITAYRAAEGGTLADPEERRRALGALLWWRPPEVGVR